MIGRSNLERVTTHLGVGVDLEATLGDGDGGDLRDVVVLALTLLLLELEGDTADGTLLDALHEVSGEAGNLVAEALGGDDGNLVGDALVGAKMRRSNEKQFDIAREGGGDALEVKREPGVVLLDHNARSTLDGLGANASLQRDEVKNGSAVGWSHQRSREKKRQHLEGRGRICWSLGIKDTAL